MRLSRWLTCMLTCSVLAACTAAPDSETWFHEMKDEDRGRATFTLDLSDSSCVYSISLIARFHKGDRPSSVTMNLSLTSPSGIRGTETVTFPSDYAVLKRYLKEHPDDSRICLASTPDYHDISWAYRDNIQPSEHGAWLMTVSLPDSSRNLRGVGLTLSKKHH